MRKTKTLPKWLADELRLLGWKTSEYGSGKGFVWLKEGVMLEILPSPTNPKMYHVTKEKMSDRDVSFISDIQLLQIIEGDSNE